MAKKSRKSKPSATVNRANGFNSAPPTREDVQAELEAAFCPPLDPTIVVSMLNDSDMTHGSLESLRDNLAILAAQTEIYLEDNPDMSPFSEDTESTSTSAFPHSSITSTSSDGSFGNPLYFVQSLFPQLPIDTLLAALNDAGASDYDVDMEAVVDRLLTDELIWEETEKGMLAEEVNKAGDWNVATTKGNKKAKHGVKISLVDIRQRHNVASSGRPSGSASQDSWTQLSSVSTRLNELLPDISQATFHSLFHTPSPYPPATTLLRFLQNLTNEECIDHDIKLLALNDALSVYDDQASHHCLRATKGDVEAAFDLILLLRDLNGETDPLIHSRPTHAQPAPSPKSPSIPMLPIHNGIVVPSAPPGSGTREPENGWTVVAKPKKASPVMHPHALFIPAYRTDRLSLASASGAESYDDYTSTDCLREASRARNARMEALRSASRNYRGGAAAKSGITAYYAEQAREHFAVSQDWSLKGAVTQVLEKQRLTGNRHEADLHGLTVNQALAATRHLVEAWWSSAGAGSLPQRPLTLITGLGKHSTDGRSVLSPAVFAMLTRGGWKAVKYPGGIRVTGETTKTSFGL